MWTQTTATESWCDSDTTMTAISLSPRYDLTNIDLRNVRGPANATRIDAMQARTEPSLAMAGGRHAG